MNNMEHFREIVVAGVGGVGWPLVVSLAQVTDGSIPIRIYDDDDFEGGKGYIRFPHIYNTKTKKVDFVRAHIESVWRKRAPEVFARRLSPKDFRDVDWKGILVVDCTDMTPKSRKQLWAAAERAGATMMRVSYDGKVANVARGLPLLSKEAQDGPGGYLEPPDLPMSFAAGGWGAKFVLHAIETGEIEEGVLRVPTIIVKEEQVDGLEETAGGALPNSNEDDGGGVDGGLDNSGASRRSGGHPRVDDPPARGGRRKVSRNKRR
jgi:hypothetical protein